MRVCILLVNGGEWGHSNIVKKILTSSYRILDHTYKPKMCICNSNVSVCPNTAAKQG